jgi:hypothetical protein
LVFVADLKKVQEDIYSNMSDEVIKHNLVLRTRTDELATVLPSTLVVSNNRGECNTVKHMGSICSRLRRKRIHIGYVTPLKAIVLPKTDDLQTFIDQMLIVVFRTGSSS